MSTLIPLALIGEETSIVEPVPSDVIPITRGKSCGTGCDSSKKTHVDMKTATRMNLFGNDEIKTIVPFSNRRLNLDATPDLGMPVVSIDMDLTVECNLRCTYCFKEKWNEHMEEQVAFDTIVWLIYASGDAENISISFMGGEPLLRFKLIEKLVPFAKRRAAQHGKNLGFSMTTNGTLVTDRVVSFWRDWGLGFHTSIDGTPDVQDFNRPTTSGQGSSRLVEKAVPKILSYQPGTTARCTVTPSSAGNLVSSYFYFRSLGYNDIAFVPGGPSQWDQASLDTFSEQFETIGDLLMDELRSGNPVRVKGIDDYAAAVARDHKRSSHACGAGRGLLLVDIHGDLWPCHRWNKSNEQEWRIGSIYEQFNEAARAPLNVSSFTDHLKNNCSVCVANSMCSGGCPAENLEETGSVYQKHPNACAYTRVWAKVGRRVYETMTAEENTLYADTYLDNPIVNYD